MIDDRSGIDLLRESIEKVAAELDRPPVRRRVSRTAVYGALISAAAGLLIVAVLLWPRATRPGVEVLSLSIDGRPVNVRVIDSRRAGSIVIVPRNETAGATVRSPVRSPAAGSGRR